MGYEARCNHCGDVVWVSKLFDYNLEKLHMLFREKNGLIPQEVLRSIPDRYKIIPSRLSLILDWDEDKFPDLMLGGNISREDSDLLLEIYNEADFFISLLERHKNLFENEVDYDRCFRAAKKYVKNQDLFLVNVNQFL